MTTVSYLCRFLVDLTQPPPSLTFIYFFVYNMCTQRGILVIQNMLFLFCLVDNPLQSSRPNHEGLWIVLPKKCIYAFLKKRLTAMLRKQKQIAQGVCLLPRHLHPVYVMDYKGEKVFAACRFRPWAQFKIIDWQALNHHWRLWSPKNMKRPSRPCSCSARCMNSYSHAHLLYGWGSLEDFVIEQSWNNQSSPGNMS